MVLECEKRAAALYNQTSPSVGAVLAPPSTGTCFVWDSHTLLTCLHVIQSTDHPQVALPCGTVLTTSISHTCASYDIAVLRSANALPTPLPRSPSPARPGQLAFAVSAAEHSPPSLTAGVVSAVGRVAPAPKEGGPALSGLVQIDASVNSGASGAPVLDSEGRLLGMVCAIASESGRFEGVAYALPIAELERVANRRMSNM